jgi:PPOX class probable F420-dependent enzyme
VVVVTFAMVDEEVVTAIDQKPKTTDRLQRLVNIEANPSVTFLVDHYENDWTRLWWVRIDGLAAVHHSGRSRDEAIAALVAKYDRYRETPPDGPVIAITPERVISWEHTP